ncbi:hypothetical protein J0P97_14775, partial [Microbacterium flavum]|nr:hypothetical protein [Microbacterium flavum]
MSGSADAEGTGVDVGAAEGSVLGVGPRTSGAPGPSEPDPESGPPAPAAGAEELLSMTCGTTIAATAAPATRAPAATMPIIAPVPASAPPAAPAPAAPAPPAPPAP